MGKKKFIDKKKAATFELCPRDTSDPLYSDAPGGDKIFLRVDQNPVNISGFTEEEGDNNNNSQFDDAPEEGDEDLAYGYSSFAGSSSNPLPADVRKEILELGYPDDGYNYLDHLREIKNTGGGSNFYANPKFEGEYLPRDVKAYDASRVKVSGVVVDGGDDDKLMYSVASKTVNVKVKRAIDPEVAALLEDSDGSEFGSDVEDLEEDFVVQANLAQEGEGSGVGNEEVVEFAVRPVAEHNQRVPRQIDELFDQLELNEYGSESDDNDGYMSGDGEEEEFRAPQSVGNDLIYEKPKDYELDEKYVNPADLLKNSDSVKDKEELENLIRRSVQYGENLVNGNEDEFVEVVEESSDESEKWDCETIVTTYSNLDNHPGRICDPDRARKKLSEALAKAKSVNGNGSRIITLQGKEKLPVEFLPGRTKAEQASVKPKAEPVKRKTHGQETKEEKKERKAAVKTEKREARKMKKETKELYRYETQRAQKAVAVSGPSSIPL
ncbi:hypothetical protein Bca4012_014571 [Brassica carinata]|uniref:Low temperature viability protein n=1 Tax=Brassica carinata TaxID=52824 RepID=A0A8X7U3Z8_BRACI|nr:hypothetical protein Bca52824_070585 [Brassica carinata]